MGEYSATDLVKGLDLDGQLSDEGAQEIADEVEELISERINKQTKRPIAVDDTVGTCEHADDFRILQVKATEQWKGGTRSDIHGAVKCDQCGQTYYYPFGSPTGVAILKTYEQLGFLRNHLYRIQGAAVRSDAPCSIYEECKRGIEGVDRVTADVENIDG